MEPNDYWPIQVAELPLFAGLAPEDLDTMLRSARSARYPKNAAVFEQGEEARSFFVRLHGHLRTAKTTPDGHQTTIRYVAPGEVFGVAVAIGMSRYPATATAVVDSVVLTWPSSAWPDLAARYPALAMNALQTVGKRLQDAHARLIEMSTEQVEQRIAHALLRLVKQAVARLKGESRSTSRSAGRMSPKWQPRLCILDVRPVVLPAGEGDGVK